MESNHNSDMRHCSNEFRLGEEHPVMIIRFRMTAWCNYACDYCNYQQVTNRRRDRFYKGLKGLWKPHNAVHAFDNYPVDQWVKAFAEIPDDYILEVSGGEPFLDYNAFMTFLDGVGGLKRCKKIRIDTNIFWPTEKRPVLDPSTMAKIVLNVSYHPTQVGWEAFTHQVDRALSSGWHVGMINYVMEERQKAEYQRIRDFFRERYDIFVNPNPNSFGDHRLQRDEMKQHLPEVDLFQKTKAQTYGRRCYFPAISYFMLPTGEIYRACLEGKREPFVTTSCRLKALGKPLTCPKQKCSCLDMYAFLLDIPDRGCELDLIREYAKACRTHQLGEGGR